MEVESGCEVENVSTLEKVDPLLRASSSSAGSPGRNSMALPSSACASSSWPSSL